MMGELREAESNQQIELVNQIQNNKTKVIRVESDINNSLNKRIMKQKLTNKLSLINISAKAPQSEIEDPSPPRKIFEIKECSQQSEDNDEFESFQFELSNVEKNSDKS